MGVLGSRLEAKFSTERKWVPCGEAIRNGAVDDHKRLVIPSIQGKLKA